MVKEKIWDPTVGKWVQTAPTQEEFTTHLAEDATLLKKGHVQLNSSVTSASEALAATPKAVKTAMERANEAFMSASNGKKLIANAITGMGVSTDSTAAFNIMADNIKNISTKPKMVASDDYIVYIDNNYVRINGTSWQIMKKVKVNYDGSLRITFDLGSSYSDVRGEGRIYINDVPAGIARVKYGTPTFFTEDFNLKKGDIVSLYAKSNEKGHGPINNILRFGADIESFVTGTEV